MQDGTFEKLGPWICLPLLFWGVIWMIVLSLPSASCDGYGDDAGPQEVLLIVVVAAASLATAGGALFRLVQLGRAKAFKAGRDLTVGGIALAAMAFAITATTSRFPAVIQVLSLVGLLLTGLALLALLVAWAAGQRVDQVGLLLPLYLLGAAVLAYPLVGLLGLASSSGALC
jgi:hypothetical protein